MKDVIYRHYGSKTIYDFKESIVCEEYFLNKPYGGLWASPADEENYYTWKQFVDESNFKNYGKNNYFDFVLKNDTNILTINEPDDLIKDKNILIDNPTDAKFNFSPVRKTLNYSYIIENYDGIELIHGNYYGFFHLVDPSINTDSPLYREQGLFYSWDCDSICLFRHGLIDLI